MTNGSQKPPKKATRQRGTRLYTPKPGEKPPAIPDDIFEDTIVGMGGKRPGEKAPKMPRGDR